jgi:hypothetical protein
VELRFLQ